MLIIIEGADRTGKTSLAKRICKKFGYDYVHFGPPDPVKPPAKEYITFLRNLQNPTVVDRFYQSELIYGPILRGKSRISLPQQLTIEKLIRYRNGFIIHADTDWGLVEKRFLEAKEPLTLEQSHSAYMGFRQLMPLSNIQFFRYNGRSKRDIDEALRQLHPYVMRQRFMRRQIDATPCP